MTRTDLILFAVRDELNERRAEIDASEGLTSVMILVKLGASGKPREIMVRPETHRRLGSSGNESATLLDN